MACLRLLHEMVRSGSEGLLTAAHAKCKKTTIFIPHFGKLPDKLKCGIKFPFENIQSDLRMRPTL